MAAPTIDQLAETARRKQDQADRAFKRWFDGEVYSPSAAYRLQNAADEAWRALTSHPDYNPEQSARLLHGDDS